jgi:peptidoglycan DL-endopeptidase CwlO
VALHAERSRLIRCVIAVFSGFGLAVVLTGGAQAAPTPAELEAQIDQAWNQLEPVIEEHNLVRVELAENKAKAQQLATQIQPLQVQLDAALGRISEMSARHYINGRASALNALLSTGSPTAFADQLSMLNAIAKGEQKQIKDVLDLKAQYDAQKAPLDQLVAKLTTQEAELATKKQTIDGEIKKLNQMRVAAYGTTGATGALRPVACPVEYAGGDAAKAAQAACGKIGSPYVWGSSGPSTFDCSGLTMYAWGVAGKRLRHYTKWQYQDTKRITRSELRAGDLVWFYGDFHHMGMYVGGGWMVHAPHSGDKVRMKKIDDMPIVGYGRVA